MAERVRESLLRDPVHGDLQRFREPRTEVAKTVWMFIVSLASPRASERRLLEAEVVEQERAELAREQAEVLHHLPEVAADACQLVGRRARASFLAPACASTRMPMPINSWQTRRADRSRERLRSSSRTATCRCARRRSFSSLCGAPRAKAERVGGRATLGHVEPDRLQLGRRTVLVKIIVPSHSNQRISPRCRRGSRATSDRAAQLARQRGTDRLAIAGVHPVEHVSPDHGVARHAAEPTTVVVHEGDLALEVEAEDDRVLRLDHPAIAGSLARSASATSWAWVMSRPIACSSTTVRPRRKCRAFPLDPAHALDGELPDAHPRPGWRLGEPAAPRRRTPGPPRRCGASRSCP